MYRVVLADPPWQFRVWSEDTGQGRSAESHYPTMRVEEICALRPPVADNAVLFLWTTYPLLFEAPQRVIEAWGFEYKTAAWTWFKSNKSGMGFHVGMGYYTRANPEPCLLAVRGTMPVAVHDVRAVLFSPVREHSQKPDDQYLRIERLYPEGPYLEMFARRRRAGWDVFGNEVEGSISLAE